MLAWPVLPPRRWTAWRRSATCPPCAARGRSTPCTRRPRFARRRRLEPLRARDGAIRRQWHARGVRAADPAAPAAGVDGAAARGGCRVNTSSPRVVHIVPALFGAQGVVGGAERYAFELARHMA